VEFQTPHLIKKEKQNLATFSLQNIVVPTPQTKKQSEKNTNTNKRSRDFWQLQSPVQRIRSIRRRNLPLSKKKKKNKPKQTNKVGVFIGLAYQGKDIVFRFIIEYSSLRDFGP
jgi:hypothetical protein